MNLMEAVLFTSEKEGEAKSLLRHRRRKHMETKRAQKRMRIKLREGAKLAGLNRSTEL